MKRPTLWLLLAVLAIAPSVLAQSLSESMTVNVVEVPVYVTRNSGAVIKNLTREDFELTVNGKPHPIDYFDVLVNDASGTAPAAEAVPVERASLERRRLVVLLFDTQNSNPHHIKAARAAAQTFVASAPAGDTFAVAVSRRDGVHFVVPFTTDRVAVQRAVTTLRISRARDSFQLATLDSERDAWHPTGVPARDALGTQEETPFNAPEVSGRFTLRVSEGAALALDSDRFREKIDRDGRARLRENAFENLALLARSLAPLSGVKHVVLLSPGLPPESDYPNFFINKVHEAYRSSGVILNAVNFGNSAPWSTGPDQSNMLVDPIRLLKDLTTDTGGVVTQNLASLRNLESVTYVLGFRPPADQKKNNTIGVKVKNAPFGAVIRHRRSYSTEPVDRSTGEELFLADVIVNDIPQTGMTVDLDVETKSDQATLVAQVPGVELLAHGRDGTTEMDVFFYVFDEKDVIATWTHLRVGLDHEKGKEFLNANKYSLKQPFRLAPGKYSAKTLLRVVGSDITGFQREDFVVPAL